MTLTIAAPLTASKPALDNDIPEGSAAPAESILNRPPRETPDGSVIFKSRSALLPAGNINQGPTFHTAEDGAAGGAGAGEGGVAELEVASGVDSSAQPVSSAAQEKRAIFSASRR